jgi:hypothetical protein
MGNERITIMTPVAEEIMALKNQPLEAIKKRYTALFQGEPPPSQNKVFLWRKIAWRLQEAEYGGLPADLQNHIQELITRYDPINHKIFRPQNPPQKRMPAKRDTRLPIPGDVIRKKYKGTTIEVKTLEKGFEYQGKIYKTLSAVATAVTGDHWNGYLFFKP